MSVFCETRDLQRKRPNGPGFRKRRSTQATCSESTERTDRHEKRLAYQRLESLKEYVLVAQDKTVIEVHRRTGNNDWEVERFDEHDDLHLESVDLTLPLTDIYQDVMNAP